MPELDNSKILENILKALYTVACRRTTHSFATAVIGAIIKTLQQNYDFLKYVRIKEMETLGVGDIISVDSDINSVDRVKVGKAIESLIRIVYMDLIGKAGLFFIKELKKHIKEEVVAELKKYGVDLAELQTEQRYLYRRQSGKKSHKKRDRDSTHDNVSLLGYTWDNVSSWEYDPVRRVCTLYDNNGNVLDQLNLDTIIESYVRDLTEDYDELPSNYKEEISLSLKEIELLQMLYSRDMDAETAIVLLHISKQEFEAMIQKLLKGEMLHYVSFNEIELTESGIKYLMGRENKKRISHSI